VTLAGGLSTLMWAWAHFYFSPFACDDSVLDDVWAAFLGDS
jgi:hypothetical protein